MENRRTTTTTRSITQSKQTDEFKKPKTLENQRATRSVTQHFSKIEEPRELAKSSSSANTQIQNPKTLGKSRSTKKYHNKIVCKKGRETKVRSKIIIQKNTRFDSVEFSVCMCVLAEGLLAGLAPLDFVHTNAISNSGFLEIFKNFQKKSSVYNSRVHATIDESSLANATV